MSISAKLPLIRYFKNYHWIMISIIFMCSACSQMDEEIQAKIDYWDKQVNIMTLLHPQKTHIFAWVFAIDPDAKYSGDSLVAKLETVTLAVDSSIACIMLIIKFNERERVREHKVTLEKRCD